ncbi:MAG: helix-turn-helix transcriptional regulator [Actinomycetota bacterium]|nr:helix-turn-helix transcriptional regulator [Actinomycetota bacterium]
MNGPRVVRSGEAFFVQWEPWSAPEPARFHRQGRTLEGLTARQWQCLLLCARGLSSEEIAADLGIARGTVDVHMDHILRRLGVHTRMQAVLKAAGVLT